MKKESISKKEKIHLLLGARQFKKIVMVVEKIKWKIIKSMFPNYLKGMEERIRKQKNELLKKAKTDEERALINSNFKKDIMRIRKEYNTEKNANYHVDILEPDKTLDWLNMNKNIHKFGLKINLGIFITEAALVGLGLHWVIPFLIINGLLAVKDFECINLQDYNIIQVEKKKEMIERYSEKTIRKRNKKFGEAQRVIAEQLDKGDEIPSIDEIIDSMDNIDKLEQFRELILSETRRRKTNVDKSEKARGIGGI